MGTGPLIDSNRKGLIHLTKALASAQTRLFALRNERGQGTLAYAGMIIAAAIIVVAVLDATGRIDLGGIFEKNVKKVTDKG
jgi:hypothetical protein